MARWKGYADGGLSFALIAHTISEPSDCNCRFCPIPPMVTKSAILYHCSNGSIVIKIYYW